MLRATVALVTLFAAALALAAVPARAAGEAESAAVQEATTIVVAVDGSGDHSTIGAALATAADGDTIAVRPGTYEEAITIERAVTLRGEGSPESVVLSWERADPPVVRLVESEAELSGLTVRAAGSFVHVTGGQPSLRGIHFDAVGSAMETDGCHALIGPDACNPVALRIDGGRAQVLDSAFEGTGGIVVSGAAAPLIEGNAFVGGGYVFLEDFSEGTTVRRNSLSGPVPSGIAIYGAGAPLVEGNVIDAAGTSGIDVGLHRQPGIEPIIRYNTISGSPTGIQLHQDANAELDANVLSGNTTAIVVTGSDARLAGNRLDGNATGVFILQGAPTLEGNVIADNTVGLGLGSARAMPHLAGNTICGNEADINLVFGAETPDASANAACP